MIRLTASNSRWAICENCDGNGKHDYEALRATGYTSGEWGEMDFDERDDYLSGQYDVQCHDCKGSGKVRELIFARLTFAEKRAYVREGREAAGRAECARESEAERRMGA